MVAAKPVYADMVDARFGPPLLTLSCALADALLLIEGGPPFGPKLGIFED